MRVRNFVLLAVVMIVGLGCAKPVHKDWFAVGGSKSDATVKLGISWNPNTEIPETSRAQADKLATDKCRTWGYDGSEAFGSTMQKCTQFGGSAYGPVCYQMEAVIEYQCTGTATPPPLTTDSKKK